MRERLGDIAPYLSILGLVALSSTLFLRSSTTSAPDWLQPVFAVVGIVLLLAWPVLRWDEFRDGLGGRQARHGANSLVLAISFVGILVVANYVSSLWYYSWDLTENKQFSISRSTIQILEDLTAPVNLVAVLTTQDAQSLNDLERLVEQYQRHSNTIEFEHIDPAADLLEIQAFANQIDQDPNALNRTLVAVSGDNHAIVYTFDEQAVTEAVVKSTRPQDLSVWFTTGHGETELDTGYVTMRSALESQGYEVSTRNLAVLTETLTADVVDAILIAGPRGALLDEEVAMLTGYVADGGAVMLMVDPQLDGTPLNLESILAPWDIELRNDVVLDPEQAYAGNLAEIFVPTQQLRFHTVTRDLMNTGSLVLFPLARSMVAGSPATTTLTTSSLVESSASAWGESDLASLSNPDANPEPTEGEPTGPITLAMAAEGGVDYGRIVVFGSSQFVADAYLQTGRRSLNLALVMNALNWLTQEEDLITIPPTQPGSYPLETPTNPNLLMIATAGLMPLAVLGVGWWIWWRRR